MKKKFELNKWRLPIALLALSIASTAYAAVGDSEPAQEPLFASVKMPAPNIMLSVDTSGSMGAMVIPDIMGADIWGGNAEGVPDTTRVMYAATLHPDDKGVTGWAYDAKMVTYVLSSRPNDIGAAVGRSPQLNKIYYNPAVHYQPWMRADGTRMPQYPASAAPMYASRATGGTVDLRWVNRSVNFANNDASGRRYHCGGITRASCSSTGSFNVTPALYFIYRAADGKTPNFGYTSSNSNIRNINNYIPIAIADTANAGGFNISQIYRAAGFTVTNPAASDYVKIDRPDCSLSGSDVVCTQAQELQNFSNWYVYYRGRMRTAIAAMTETFAQDFGMEYRMGWGDYSDPGGNNSYGGYDVDDIGNYFGIRQGVRSYLTGSPHRTKFYTFLNDLEYKTTSNGTPTHYALRGIGQYFKNEDHKGPWGKNPETGASSPHISCRKAYAILFTDGGWNTAINVGNADKDEGHPYADSHPNTLADVAMVYWKNDLQPNLTNNVPNSTDDTANWQHLVTHTVGFGVTGTLTPVPTKEIPSTLVWPYPGGNNDSSWAERIDDLWHTAVNGRGTFSSASDPRELVESLKSIMEGMASQDVPSANRVTATDYLEAENRAFVPSYVTGSWTGDLSSRKMGMVEHVLTLGDAAWQASSKMPAYNSRNIWIGTKNVVTNPLVTPIAFNPTDVSGNASLSAVFNDVDPTKNEDLVNYLRGDNTKITARNYRTRGANILGDIINSNPVYVGVGDSFGYGKLPTTIGGKTEYVSYHKSKAGRAPVIFVGANDGMLHAFDAETGVELFAYIPAAVVSKLPQLALPTFETKHRYYVDGPLNLVDAAIGTGVCDSVGTSQNISCWSSVLVGSAGAGAKAIFALDVTDPKKYSSSSTAMDIGKTVLWEITPETGTGTQSMADLGNVMQPVQVGVAGDGRWVGVFGNGAHSKKGAAVLFVVDLKTGLLINKIVLDNAGNNGLMGVTLIRDANNVIKGAYAGDLKGNLWSFDLSDKKPDLWKSRYSNGGGTQPEALYSTTPRRPISQAPVATPFENNGKKGYMVLFGTGKYYDIADKNDGNKDALYGVWDNGLEVAASESLVERGIEAVPGKIYYTLINQAQISWGTQRGWKVLLDGVGDGQRSLYSPTISGPNVLFSTTFTGGPSSATEDCTISTLPGALIAVNLYTGLFPTMKWDTNGDGIIDAADGQYVGLPSANPGPEFVLVNPNLDASDEDGIVKCKPGEVYGALLNTGAMTCQKAHDNTAWAQLF